MTASRAVLFICLSFIVGIAVSSFLEISQALMLGFSIPAIILISLFWRHKRSVVIGLCLLFSLLGIWRHQNVVAKIPELNEEDINLTGEVVAEPDVREKTIRLTIKTRDVEGKILVTTWRYPEYQYGDKLKISGKLEIPSEDIGGWNYRDYLKKDGIYAVMSWPKIESIGSGFGNPLMSVLFYFKNKFKVAASRFISPPQQGILEALLFGDEDNISKEWKNKLNLTGTRHVTAVSGMNITIIASLLLSLALGLGLWRRQALYLSIFLLILYILMIGAPASAVRAGVMGIILLLSQYLGRLSSATRAVVFAATLMLFLNPLLLKSDIGFQLSFLAVLGMIYLQPVFLNWLKILPDPKIFPLRATLSTTLAAQVFTLPILIYNFGYIPILSPITNILIVPLLAPITILIFFFGIAALIFGPLGHVLSWPVWLSLTYLVGIISGFSKLSFASLVLENMPWPWLIICYLILGCFVWRLKKDRFSSVFSTRLFKKS